MRLFILLLLAIAPFQIVSAAPRICNSTESAIIAAAVADAKSNIQEAQGILESLINSSNPKFQKWFGDAEPTRTAKIKDAYIKMVGFADFQTYYCPLTSSPELALEKGVLAAVWADDITSMFFTPDYFSLADTGADSKMGVIVHELSHYLLTGKTGDADDRYGEDEAQKRAKDDPGLAVETADNFQYFVESVAFGI